MKIRDITLSVALFLATTAGAFATCHGKQRISCADGFVFDHGAGACVSATVTSS